MYELNRRMKDKNVNVKVMAAHPGVSRTELTRYMLNPIVAKLMLPLFWIFTQSAKNGAQPQLRAALDPNVTTGEYYGSSGFREMKGSPVLVKAEPNALNEKDAKDLWELSEKLVNMKFNI